MRFLSALFATLLWCAAACAAPPALDGASPFLGCNASGNPLTAHATLTTTNSQDAIIVFIIFGDTGSWIHTITDTAGLTFTRRAAFGSQINGNDRQEEWWAPAPSPLVSDTITVTALPNVSSGCMKAFAIGISGAQWPVPFDPLFNYPVYSPSSSTVSFTTQGTSDFLLAFYQLFLCAGGSSPGAGWSAIYNPSGSQAQVLVQSLQVTSPQSGLTAGWSCSPSGSLQSSIIDAFVAPGGLGSVQQSSKVNSYVILQTGMGTSKLNEYVILVPGIGTSKFNMYAIQQGTPGAINQNAGLSLFHAFPP